MRSVTRLMVLTVVAAVAALLLNVSAASGRPGGGHGRGGPSAARSGGHGPAQAAGSRNGAAGRQPGSGPAGPAAQAGRNPQEANWQQQAAQQLRQQAGQWQQAQNPPANWQGRGRARQNAQAWWNNYQNGPQPFTPAWYTQHPQAWHVTHPYANEWAVATAAGLAGWLGWAYAAPPSSYSSTTILFDDVPVGPQETDTLAEVYVDASPSDVVLPSGDWMPLGVYSLVGAPDRPPTQLLQLSVDRQGVIRGIYYDAVTDTSHNVIGSMSRNSQQAEWSLESNPNLAFRAAIDQLMQAEGVVEVSLPGGVEQWHLVRMEDAGQ
jgi:hypothetical protein